MKIFILIFTIYLNLIANSNVKNLESFKATFKQTITNKNGKKLHYTGEFYAKKNNLALWKYKTPIKKIIYYYKNSITIVEPDLEQAIITAVNKKDNLLKIIKDAKRVAEDRYIATCCDMHYNIFTDKNGGVRKIVYKDKLGNTNSIIFENREINKNIKNSLFRPKVPEDFDIITR